MRDVALMPVHHRGEMPTVLLSGSDSADLLIGIGQKGVEFPAESAAARHLRMTASSRFSSSANAVAPNSRQTATTKDFSEEFEGYTGNAGNTLDRWTASIRPAGLP